MKFLSLLLIILIGCSSIKKRNPERTDYTIALNSVLNFMADSIHWIKTSEPIYIFHKYSINSKSCNTYGIVNFTYYKLFINESNVQRNENIKKKTTKYISVSRLRDIEFIHDLSIENYNQKINFVDNYHNKLDHIFHFTPLIETAKNKYEIWAYKRPDLDRGSTIFYLEKVDNNFKVLSYQYYDNCSIMRADKDYLKDLDHK